jgi:hypothetical protein
VYFLVQADCSESADDGWWEDRVYRDNFPQVLAKILSENPVYTHLES